MPMMFDRRTLIKAGIGGGVSVAALAGGMGAAQALVKITVTGGDFEPLPIAIPDFGSSDSGFGREIAAIVRDNLRNSGLFLPLAPDAMPLAVGSSGATPEFGAWRITSSDAVVMADVEKIGGQVRANVRLWDIAEGTQIFGQQYVTDQVNWRRAAHIVSDAIYTSLTGEGGYFDTRVVFVAESGSKANRVKRLAIMDQDGANLRYLSSGTEIALTPRFSPIRQEITYMALEDGRPRVYLYNIESGAREIVGNFNAMSFSPRYSPDGQKIVLSLDDGGNSNLYSLDLRSRQASKLTATAAIDTAPCFSPDGRRIVFESDRGGSQQIYVMSASGGGAQRISFGQGSYSTPVWSPKGEHVAFTKISGGQFHIGIMKPDGSGERILASSFHAEGPTWAPNGRVLMFFRDDGGGPSLYSIDIWGRNERRIPTPTYASDPTWSPLIS